MRKVINVVILSAFLAAQALYSFAAEHGGKTMEMKNPAGTEISEPTSAEIDDAIHKHIDFKSKASGTFNVYDTVTGKTRKLALEDIHEKIGKTGSYYYSCADFKDTETGETLDLDFDIKKAAGRLTIENVRIHKVNGKARYMYDENNNRVPVSE